MDPASNPLPPGHLHVSQSQERQIGYIVPDVGQAGAFAVTLLHVRALDARGFL